MVSSGNVSIVGNRTTRSGISASDQVENRWFSPYERIWHPASNVTPAMRPNWTILSMYFSLELPSRCVIKLVKIVAKAPTDTGNDGPSPAGGQLGYARRSVAMRQMVVNQSLQPGKKLLVGDFIGSSLSFGFQLRSRGAVFLPRRRVY